VICGTSLPAASQFCNKCGTAVTGQAATPPRFSSPESYTPPQLAQKILTCRSALEGERKQVTGLFADLKGSMELLADRDPEEARRLLDPVRERMMEAVHRYEGTVNQVMGDGIMSLSGPPSPTKTTRCGPATPRSTCRGRCAATRRTCGTPTV
jgi:class 3 adenylate cyclase